MLIKTYRVLCDSFQWDAEQLSVHVWNYEQGIVDFEW